MINVVYVLTLPVTCPSLIPLPLLWLPESLRHSSIEIRPVNNPTVASKWSDKWKSLTTLTLSPKLGMIYFVSDKGQNRPKARPFVPNSQVVNAEEKFSKEIRSTVEKSFVKGKVSQYSKIHCRFKQWPQPN